MVRAVIFNWLRFLRAYFIACVVSSLMVALIMGVPLALIAVCVWHK